MDVFTRLIILDQIHDITLFFFLDRSARTGFPQITSLEPIKYNKKHT